jgi:hypothetical protein
VDLASNFILVPQYIIAVGLFLMYTPCKCTSTWVNDL